MSEEDRHWKEVAKGLVKGELAKRSINYIQLSDKLKAIGVEESPQNLSNKIARGTFGAIFMLQIFDVIGCKNINLGD
jgi:hypothetical protein